MVERKGRLQIDLLGTSFALAADQPAEYLQSIYNHYKKVVSEVQQTSGVNDSLRVAIIAGILLSDELRTAKPAGNDSSKRNRSVNRAVNKKND